MKSNLNLNRRSTMKAKIIVFSTLIVFATVATLMAGYGMKKDIVETAVRAGSFNTLVTAVKAADLVETLKGEGPFTVFAPTDEAFAKLPDGTIENLLKPENKGMLQSILTYHIVPGKVLAGDVITLDSADTVNGKSLKISSNNGYVMIEGAKVLKTDILCSNGVIHVIDTVMLP